MNYIESFKYLITEFQTREMPKIQKREFNYADIGKIVSIIGFRRSGKTYILYQEITNLLQQGVEKESILYINFEDDRILHIKVSDLQSVLDAYYELYPQQVQKQKYLFLDEIQVVDNWEVFVRRIHDTEKMKIFVTGSSSKLLSKELATSLRGRTLSYEIYPLSFSEYLDFKGFKKDQNIEYSNKRYEMLNYLENYVALGGFPEVALHEENSQEILQNYYDLLVYKDLVDRYTIRNVNTLRTLIKYLLTNIGNVFSINKYFKAQAEQNQVARQTITEYLTYLEETLVIIPIKLFSYSLKIQQVNPIKIYCLDTGLRNQVAFYFSRDMGRMVENIVCVELKRRKKEIYYWKGKNEVDFVIKEKGNTLQAINVSYTDEIAERELKGLKEFNEEYMEKKTILLLLTKNRKGKEGEIELVPVWKWLIE